MTFPCHICVKHVEQLLEMLDNLPCAQTQIRKDHREAPRSGRSDGGAEDPEGVAAHYFVTVSVRGWDIPLPVLTEEELPF